MLVDLGLVAELTEEEAAHYIGFLRAVGEGDGGAAADCVLQWRTGSKTEVTHLYVGYRSG